VIKVFIFDLDGVITETSHQHYEAWKALAKMIGIEIDYVFNERLKGVSRIDSLKEILKYGNKEDVYSDVEIEKLAFCKNEYYKSLISQFTRKDVFDGVIELFEALQDKGIKIAIGSASYNAPGLIKAMELEKYIDYIVDPSEVEKGKPAPDIFLKAAEVLGAKPEECIGIEDAVAGVKAIKAAEMYSVGIGDVEILKEADIIYNRTGDIDLTELLVVNN